MIYYKLILDFDKEIHLKNPEMFESKKKICFKAYFWDKFWKCEGLSLKFKVSLND